MLIMLLGTFFACTSEIDNKEAASVKEVSKDASTNAQNTAKSTGSSWALAPSSKVEWVGAKVTGDHTGGFKTVKGAAQVEGGTLKQITADIEISSLFSDHPKLTKHLLNADFFEVDKYTKASFRSTEISASNIKGILDLHGVQKEISFSATISVSEKSVDIKSEFTINRRLWGINYDGRANDLIKDDVLIKLDVQYKS